MKEKLKPDYLWTPLMFISGAMGLLPAMLFGAWILTKHPHNKRAVRTAAATVAFTACMLAIMSVMLVVFFALQASHNQNIAVIVLAALSFQQIAVCLACGAVSFLVPGFMSWGLNANEQKPEETGAYDNGPIEE